MIIKKFESFNNDKLFYQVDYIENFELLNTDERGESISEREFQYIKDLLHKTYFKNIKSIKKESPSSIGAYYIFISILISKKDDYWWYIKVSYDLSGRREGYKCDTIEGLRQFLEEDY